MAGLYVNVVESYTVRVLIVHKHIVQKFIQILNENYNLMLSKQILMDFNSSCTMP